MSEPGPGQVRVAVHASGINPVDAKVRRAGSWAGFELPAVLGYDVSGVVDAVGPGVSDLSVGDEVYYTPELFGERLGGYAEYHVADASIVARKPANLTHVEAAAVPLAGGTAYEAVVRRLALQPGETVLVHGAAGGVGTYAVQLAAGAGATTVASASAHHHEVLRQLGAALCVDYHEGNAAVAAERALSAKLDAVVDLVGGTTLAESLESVRPFGRLASIVSLEGDLYLMLLHNLTLHGVFLTRERDRLDRLRERVEAGRLRPVVDQVLPLEEVARAHERVESGHGRGKVVLRVREG